MASMWALVVAVIYFGSFLAIGFIAKAVLAKLMKRTGADLSDVQAQAGPTAGSARSSCWESGVMKNEREVRRRLGYSPARWHTWGLSRRRQARGIHDEHQ